MPISLFPHSALSEDRTDRVGHATGEFRRARPFLTHGDSGHDIFGCRRGFRQDPHVVSRRGSSRSRDRELLTQLFVNLIENALRHTPEGATVGMSLRKNEHGLIADVFEARDTRNGARQRIQALLPPGKQPKHTGQRAWACASSHRRRSPQRTNHARRQLSRAQGHAAI